MTARLLGPDDALLWRALWAEAQAEVPGAFACRPQDSDADSPGAVAARRASVRPFVWELADAEAAVACALWCPDGDPVRAERRGRVEAVFVRRHVRGRGIAGRLLAALIEDARAHGIVELWLEVGRGNAAALSAYVRAGFTPATVPAARAGELAMRRRLDA